MSNVNVKSIDTNNYISFKVMNASTYINARVNIQSMSEPNDEDITTELVKYISVFEGISEEL